MKQMKFMAAGILLLTWVAQVGAANYTEGVFFVNEDWFGHDHGSVNYLDANGNMHYRVYRAENADDKFGVTTQFGCIYDGKFYFVSKQAGYSGEEGVGSRLTIADAVTLQKIAGFENIGGGDGRSFLGITPQKGYIGTSNGICIFNIADMQVDSIINGTSTGNSLYTGQIGTMVKYRNKVFAAKQSTGVYIIDTQTDTLMATINLPDIITLTLAKDSMVYAAVDTCLWRINPQTEDAEAILFPKGITMTSSWGAWNAGSLCAGTVDTVLYFMNGGSWGSNGNTIVRYRINDHIFDSNFYVLPNQDTTYKEMFYGASFRPNPATGDLVLTTTESGWSTHYQNNWIRIVDGSTAELKETITLEKYYWFPAMPVFPDIQNNTIGTVQKPTYENNNIIYSDGILQVRVSSDATLQLFDAFGRCVLNTFVHAGENQIVLSSLLHGVYIVHCNHTTLKFIK